MITSFSTSSKEESCEPMKKLKGARKKIKRLESEFASEQEARKALEERVSKLERGQGTLMFNLRRVFKKLDMKPKHKAE